MAKEATLNDILVVLKEDLKVSRETSEALQDNIESTNDLNKTILNLVGFLENDNKKRKQEFAEFLAERGGVESPKKRHHHDDRAGQLAFLGFDIFGIIKTLGPTLLALALIPLSVMAVRIFDGTLKPVYEMIDQNIKGFTVLAAMIAPVLGIAISVVEKLAHALNFISFGLAGQIIEPFLGLARGILKFVKALWVLSITFEALLTGIKRAMDVWNVTKDWKQTLIAFGFGVLEGLYNWIADTFIGIGRGVDWVLGKFGIKTEIGKTLTTLKDNIFIGFKLFFNDMLSWIQAIFSWVKEIRVENWPEILKNIKLLFGFVFSVAKIPYLLLKKTYEFMKPVIDKIFPIIKDIFSKIIDGLMMFFGKIWGFVKKVLGLKLPEKGIKERKEEIDASKKSSRVMRTDEQKSRNAKSLEDAESKRKQAERTATQRSGNGVSVVSAPVISSTNVSSVNQSFVSHSLSPFNKWDPALANSY